MLKFREASLESTYKICGYATGIPNVCHGHHYQSRLGPGDSFDCVQHFGNVITVVTCSSSSQEVHDVLAFEGSAEGRHGRVVKRKVNRLSGRVLDIGFMFASADNGFHGVSGAEKARQTQRHLVYPLVKAKWCGKRKARAHVVVSVNDDDVLRHLRGDDIWVVLVE